MGDTTRDQVSLDIGQTKVLEWQVDKDNIRFREFHICQSLHFPRISTPLREATCGIYVINLPIIKGSQWLGLAMVLGIGGLGLGLIY